MSKIELEKKVKETQKRSLFLLSKIEKEVKEASSLESPDWGDYGSLLHAEEKLKEILLFLGGEEAAEEIEN